MSGSKSFGVLEMCMSGSKSKRERGYEVHVARFCDTFRCKDSETCNSSSSFDFIFFRDSF